MIALLILARWATTSDLLNRVLQQYAPAANNRIIVAILPQDKALRQYNTRQLVEPLVHVPYAGFVNARQLIILVLLSDLTNYLSLMEWLQNHICLTNAHFTDEAYIHPLNHFILNVPLYVVPITML